MIKTIIFDLGGVIVPFDIKRGYARLAPLCNCAVEEIPKRLRSTDLVTRFETGRLSSEQFVEELSNMLNLRITYDEFRGIWNCIFLPGTLVPESLLLALRGRYRMLLLSNTNALHFSMVEAHYPLIRHFHHKVLSYEVGSVKPSPGIYEEALARAGCRPEECFFTDDVLPYVEGARRAGIDAVQFQSVPQLEEELRARGIQW